jgi:subtilisin family serine protease
LFQTLDPATLESVDSAVSRNFRVGQRRARQFFNWTGLGQKTLGGLEWDLAEPVTAAPSAPTDHLPQPYLGAAPRGVDAEYAWDRGYRGQGIRIVDLETGWFFEHELLRAAVGVEAAPVYNHNRLRYGTSHGTKVLGVVAASHAGHGIRGIAPEATVRVVSRRRCRPPSAGQTWPGRRCRNTYESDRWDVAGAIIAAVRELGSGGILLLEVETKYGYPIELVDHCFDAIRVAVGNGVTVIEPGGNGARKLDRRLPRQALWQGSFGLRRDDSGAILVGSCERGLEPLGRRRSGHTAIEHSSYGSRVDCYAWGEAVATTGPGIRRYVTDFGGTSAASAIVAGVAILVQQIHYEHTEQLLTPREMRALLRDPRLGTACVLEFDETGRPKSIGVMPNLRELIRVLEQLTPGDVPPRGTRERLEHVPSILRRARRTPDRRRFFPARGSH